VDEDVTCASLNSHRIAIKTCTFSDIIKAEGVGKVFLDNCRGWMHRIPKQKNLKQYQWIAHNLLPQVIQIYENCW